VILYLGGTLGFDDVNSGMYDFFLPGGGVLVWHVNEDRIESGLADNTINRYGDGLRLLEADGIQDIGVIDAYVIGWLGSARDPFGGYDFEGNTNDFTELYVDAFPSSRMYDRSWTGFAMRDVGPYAPGSNGAMVLTARVEPLVGAFPFTAPAIDAVEAAAFGGDPAPRGIEPASLVPLPITGEGEPPLGFVGRAPADWEGDRWRPVVFAVDAAGAPAFDPVAGLPTAGIARLSGPLAGPPVLQGGSVPQVVFGSRDGVVAALPAAAGSTAPDFAWSLALDSMLSYGPVSGGGSDLLLPVAADSLLLVDRDGELIGDLLALAEPGGGERPRLAGAPRTAPSIVGPGWVVPTGGGWFRVTADRSGLEPDPTFHPYAGALADSVEVQTALLRDPTGDLLLIFGGGANLGSWRLTADGVEELGVWSAWRDAGEDAELVAEPAVADLDGNGRDDVILLTARRIHAYQASGVPLSGFPVRLLDLFPLPDSTRIAGPAVVCDTDADPANEIYLTTDGGHLVGLEADGSLVDHTPYRWGDISTSGLAAGAWVAGDDRRVLWLVSGGGTVGPPLERQYRNGRLMGYALPGGGADGATSEWLAAAGNFARTGPRGEAADLEQAAPLAAFAAQPIVYPNPLREDDLTLRFYSAGGATAEFALYNLEGEEVVRESVAAVAGEINEFTLNLPGLASGLYLCRLIHDAGGSRETTIITLAVER
jgi:hypothetical protein